MCKLRRYVRNVIWYFFFRVAHVHRTENKNTLEDYNWSLEDGWNIETDLQNFERLYPQRSFMPVAAEGIFFNTKAHKKDLDYICAGSAQGYKIFLHAPGEIPALNVYYYLQVSHKNEAKISVSPTSITSSQRLRKLNPNKYIYFI